MQKKDINKDEFYFTITEVSKQIGVVPATIRNWERQGLFTAKRTENGYRIYDLNDIERLRLIRRHSKDESMGIKAIKILYGPPVTLPQKTRGDALVSKKLLGEKWKQHRLERGYMLEDVAREINISASYLSKIENVQANVSMDILQKLAAFYGENIMYYVKEAENETNVVRKDNGEEFTIGIDGLSIESVVELKHNTLSSMIYKAEPGSGRVSGTTHSGEEFLHILNGRIQIRLNEQTFILKAGDSMCFRSSENHSWYNCGKTPARILWVYTPLVRQ